MKNLLLFLASFVLANCTTTQADYNVKYKIRITNGDTLAAIAEKYDTTWQSIAELNNLGTAPKISPGQILILKPGPGGLRADMGITDPASTEQPGLERGSNKRKKGLLFNGSGQVRGVWPVVGEVSSEFGRRGRRLHAGLDIRAPRGTTIIAVKAGKIEFAGWKSGYGKTVIIDHGSYKTLYAHCSQLNVTAGSAVRQGQQIGAVGQSGNASGYHLHFEFLDARNNPRDPREILSTEAISGVPAH